MFVSNPMVQVGKVGVHSSHLLGIQCLSKDWLAHECRKEQMDTGHASRLIRLLMGHLRGLPPGQYLLTHQPGAGAVSCFTANLDDMDDVQVGELGWRCCRDCCSYSLCSTVDISVCEAHFACLGNHFVAASPPSFLSIYLMQLVVNA